MDKNELRRLVDTTHKCAQAMVDTHSYEDVRAFITCVYNLEQAGYAVGWNKHRHLVTITRRQPCPPKPQ